MQKSTFLIVALVIVVIVQALILVGRPNVFSGQKAEAPKAMVDASAPVRMEPIVGTNLKRVILSQKAAERLDIKTAPVREQEVVRKRIAVGEIAVQPAPSGVVAASAAGGAGRILVRVPLDGDLRNAARGKPITVHAVTGGGGPGISAKPVETPAGVDSREKDSARFYALDEAAPGLSAGQRVRVELTLADSGGVRKVAPYAAVIYDPKGATYVYTSPAPLVFVRHRIKVDYIDGELAILSEGPPSGTLVVTVGGMELYGAEFFVGN